MFVKKETSSNPVLLFSQEYKWAPVTWKLDKFPMVGGVGGLQLAIYQHPYQGVRRTPTPTILHKLWQRPRFHLFS